jgi:PHD/YefM family antitoxin component YafN of YafNO toxin-antitoxin module
MGQIIAISSREFREKQNNYFDLADQGAQIILKRGRKRAYILTPADDDDDSWQRSPELQEVVEQGLKDIKEGKGRRYTLDELKKRMGLA